MQNLLKWVINQYPISQVQEMGLASWWRCLVVENDAYLLHVFLHWTINPSPSRSVWVSMLLGSFGFLVFFSSLFFIFWGFDLLFKFFLSFCVFLQAQSISALVFAFSVFWIKARSFIRFMIKPYILNQLS